MNFANVINFTKPITGDWIVDIILWLVTICSSVGVGVILFTLILKVVTLPFDFISKIQMRKNSVLMEQMRPDLEKLQKQYANDKEKYSQKMMALYKKNGYSMWGSCLPMILTLVIFIVAINGFTSYSQYQNRQYFYDMSLSYNSVIYDAFEEDGDLIKMVDGKLVFNDQALFNKVDWNNGEKEKAIELSNGKWIKITHLDLDENNFTDAYAVAMADETSINYQEKSYIRYVRYCDAVGNAFYDIKFEILSQNLDNGVLVTENGLSYIDFKTANFDSVNQKVTEENVGASQDVIDAKIEQTLAYNFILDIQQTRAAKSYQSVDKSFLWVKNIWVTDSPMKHPIETDWESFKSVNKYEDKNVNATDYANLIGKLEVEKTEPNGYFILVAITALSSLLMQFITSKAQKAQMELQTVDGQGAQTNKMMMWMMPIMMAIFAFMYTAAFSIYIILSNFISIGTTLLINAIVDKKYKMPQGDETTRSRIYVAKPEEKKEEPKKKTSWFAPKEEEPVNDFLTGKADKKKRK